MQLRLWLPAILSFFILNTSLAQDEAKAFVDLGVFEGEVEKVSYQLSWQNESDTGVRLKVGNIGQLIKGDTIYKQVKPKAKQLWELTLDLPENAGIYFDSVSLISKQGVVAQTYYFQYQVLQPEVDVFKAFRNEFWPFRAKEQVFNLKAATRGDTLSATFDLFNLGGKDLMLSNVSSADSIQVAFLPKNVPHDRFTKVTLTVPTYKSSQLGFVKRILPIIKGNDTIAYFPIQYTLFPEKSQSNARLGITKVNFDFRVVEEGEIATEVIFLSNNGSDVLNIEKVESNCDCLRFELTEESIKPGENAQLKVVFDFTNRTGLERKTLAVFSNDGVRPVQVITFKAHVK